MVKESGRSRSMSLLATSMMVNMLWTVKMDLVSSCGNQEIFTKATMLMMNETAMARCSGQMDPSTKASGKLAFSTAMVK
jgi:hypothetical protein